MKKVQGFGVALLLAILIIAGCSSGPKPIQYGSDQCDHCKMVITEQAFAAELVTGKGKAFKFDAIECMAAYLTEHPDLQNEQTRRWVHDFARPESWINAENALFVQSKKIQSPMGLSILAFSSESDMKTHLQEYPGERIRWSEIVEQVDLKW